MMHFTCDLCGKELHPGEEDRYVVKIEAFAATDAATLTEADLDEDNMEAIGELLRDLEDGEGDLSMPEPNRNFRYDLCPECHQRFLRDPLGKEQQHKFFFSKN